MTMRTTHLLLILATSTALTGGVIMASPSVAQPNQSDITGTNVFESYAPDFSDFEGLDEAVIQQAEELSQQLNQANQACIDSQALAARRPRRFARGVRPSSAVCISPECQQLNQVREDVRLFISQVESQIEELNQATDERPW